MIVFIMVLMHFRHLVEIQKYDLQTNVLLTPSTSSAWMRRAFGFWAYGIFFGMYFSRFFFSARAFFNLRLTFGRRLQDAVVFFGFGVSRYRTYQSVNLESLHFIQGYSVYLSLLH